MHLVICIILLSRNTKSYLKVEYLGLHFSVINGKLHFIDNHEFEAGEIAKNSLSP